MQTTIEALGGYIVHDAGAHIEWQRSSMAVIVRDERRKHEEKICAGNMKRKNARKIEHTLCLRRKPRDILFPWYVVDVQVHVEARVGCLVSRASVQDVSGKVQDVPLVHGVCLVDADELRVVLQRDQHAQGFYLGPLYVLWIVIVMPCLLPTMLLAMDGDDAAHKPSMLQEAQGLERLYDLIARFGVLRDGPLNTPSIGVEYGLPFHGVCDNRVDFCRAQRHAASYDSNV
jgi:hypothetical protein